MLTEAEATTRPNPLEKTSIIRDSDNVIQNNVNPASPISEAAAAEESAYQLAKRVLGEKEALILREANNTTLIQERETQYRYEKPIYDNAVETTDRVVKTGVATLEGIALAAGKTLEKSDELAHDWTNLIHQMNQHIKAYNAMPLAKILKWTTCATGVLFIIWKMGLVGKIPNFISTVLNLVPSAVSHHVATLPTSTVNSKVSTEVTDKTFQALLDTPLTPLFILSAVGVAATCIGIFKILRFITRK